MLQVSVAPKMDGREDAEMTTGFNRPTADIIQFPVSARMSAAAQARDLKRIEELGSVPMRDFGSWYHEDAIVASERDRQPQA